MTSAFWNERFSGDQLAYGEAPNDFLVEMAPRLPSAGSALDLGAGEGRNALFLASRGLDVLAIDQSDIGLRKAQQRAQARTLTLRTQVADLADFDAPPSSFDVITSIYVHLPAALRATVHTRVQTWLKPGGVFILEAYAPDQVQRTTGGPKEPSRLASLDELVAELPTLRIEHRAALVRPVVEGLYHTGEASVVQLVARRP